MYTYVRWIICSLLAIASLAAQHRVTVHVECGSQSQTDNEWTVDFDVEVTNLDGSKTDHHVHVDVDNHSNAAAITDTLAHKLRKKTGLNFASVPTTNPVGVNVVVA